MAMKDEFRLANTDCIGCDTKSLAQRLLEEIKATCPEQWQRMPKMLIRDVLAEIRAAAGLGRGRDESDENRLIRALRRQGLSAEAIARTHFGQDYLNADKSHKRDMRNEIRQRWRVRRKGRKAAKPVHSKGRKPLPS